MTQTTPSISTLTTSTQTKPATIKTTSLLKGINPTVNGAGRLTSAQMSQNIAMCNQNSPTQLKRSGTLNDARFTNKPESQIYCKKFTAQYLKLTRQNTYWLAIYSPIMQVITPALITIFTSGLGQWRQIAFDFFIHNAWSILVKLTALIKPHQETLNPQKLTTEIITKSDQTCHAFADKLGAAIGLQRYTQLRVANEEQITQLVQADIRVCLDELKQIKEKGLEFWNHACASEETEKINLFLTRLGLPTIDPSLAMDQTTLFLQEIEKYKVCLYENSVQIKQLSDQIEAMTKIHNQRRSIFSWREKRKPSPATA